MTKAILCGMRIASPIVLSQEERAVVSTWTRGRSLPLRLIQRAQIVVMAAQGIPSRDIAQALEVSRPTVQLWRERFLALRLEGLKKDAPRPGRIPSIPEKKVRAVVQATLHTTPRGATHWSIRTMAKAQGISRMAVQSSWDRHDYKRNCTTTLFASLIMLDGKVIGDCMPRHRHQEFIRFLNKIDAETPSNLDLHLIVDNYATHKHPRVKSWMRRHPRFHIHFIP